MNDRLRSIIEERNGNVLFAGVGNVLRRDDGAGVFIVKGIKERKNISTLLVEVSIENYISRINQAAPDILIIADCVDFKREPGFADLIPVEEINEFDVSSHNISLKRVSEFLKMKTYVLGIQPSDLRVGEYMTPDVKESAEKIIGIVNDT
jgi:hydrogenase 3 maturation protease